MHCCALLTPILTSCAICCWHMRRKQAKRRATALITPMMIFKICSLTTRAASLSLYNHFAEICTSPKTTQKLVERDSTDAIEKIARLLIIENSGNTDELLKEAEAVIKHSKDMNTRIMAQIVVRKHLLYNEKLSFSKKQQLVDRIFRKSARKTLLSPSRTL